LTKEIALQLLTAMADELESLEQREAARGYRRAAEIVADIEIPRARRRRLQRQTVAAPTDSTSPATTGRLGPARKRTSVA